MNEAPFPAQTTVPRTLSPPAEIAPAPRVGRLRASLAACSREGVAAEALGACFGNAVLTAWALELGASSLLVGALWGLPYFGQIFQLPGAWITSRFGVKRTAVVFNAIARQVLLPIAALPFVPLGIDAKRAILVTLFALSSLFSTLGNNGWLAWMGELVPARVRGRYFGRRTAMCTATATLATFAVASALDAGRARHALGIVLASFIVARSVLGVLTTVLMQRQHEPRVATIAPTLRDSALPLLDRVYRGILVYRAAWGVATGLAASVSAIYLLESLGLGFVGIAGYGALVAALRVLSAPLWGRTLDRTGALRVLVGCSFGVAASSFFWVGATAGHPWMIALDAVLSGVLLGGQELAVFTLPLDAAPSARRPLFVASSVAVGGVAYGIACAAGGALAASTSARAVLLSSACARVLAAGTALLLVGRAVAVADGSCREREGAIQATEGVD